MLQSTAYSSMSEGKIIAILTSSRGLYMLGSCLYLIAANITIYRFTENGIGIALLMIAKNLPVILGGIFTGNIIDKTSKSLVMVIALFSQSLLVATLFFLNTPLVVIAVMFLYMCAYSLYKPAQSVIKPVLLSSKTLLRANSIMMIIEEIATIVASILIARTFENSQFFLTALSVICLALAGGVLLAFILPVEKRNILIDPNANDVHIKKNLAAKALLFWSETKTGWLYLLKTKRLILLAMIVALIWLGLGSFSSIQIIYISTALSLPNHYVGYSEAIISIGNMAGYALAPFICKILIGQKSTIAMGLGYIAGGIFLSILGVNNSIFVSFFALALYACAYGFSNTIEETLEQTLPDSEYIGTAISVISTIGTAGYLIGMIFAPLLTDVLDVRFVIILSALLTVLSGLAVCIGSGHLFSES